MNFQDKKDHNMNTDHEPGMIVAGALIGALATFGVQYLVGWLGWRLVLSFFAGVAMTAYVFLLTRQV